MALEVRAPILENNFQASPPNGEEGIIPKITLQTIPLENQSQLQAVLDGIPGTVLRWALTQVDPLILEVVALQ